MYNPSAKWKVKPRNADSLFLWRFFRNKITYLLNLYQPSKNVAYYYKFLKIYTTNLDFLTMIIFYFIFIRIIQNIIRFFETSQWTFISQKQD